MTDLTACLRRQCPKRMTCLRFRTVYAAEQIVKYHVGPRYECHMPIRPGARVESEILCDLRADPDAEPVVGAGDVETMPIGGRDAT